MTLERLGDPYSTARPLLVPADSRVFALGGARAGEKGELTGGSVDDAAQIEPGASSWTEISGLPAKPPLDNPAAVWTGEDLIVVGTPCDGAFDGTGDDEFANCGDAEVAGRSPAISVFAYSPGSETWRTLESPPDLPRRTNGYPASVLAHGWTGEDAIFEIAIGGAPEAAGLWLFDPATEHWRHGPERLPNRSECMVGSALYDSDVGELVGAEGITDLQDDLKAPIRTWKFDTDALTWVELAPVEKPSVGQSQNLIRCQGGAMVFSPRTDTGMNSGVLWFGAATERWTTVPSFDNAPGDLLATFDIIGESNGTKVVAWPGTDRVLALVPGADQWTERLVADAKAGLLPIGPITAGILVENGVEGPAVLRVAR